LPGPTLQFVAIETLICGVSGVSVNKGVGDSVCVGVFVGVKVKVGVADSSVAMGTTARGVCDNPAKMVAAATVPMSESEIGAGVPDVAQAIETINKTATDKRMGDNFDFNMVLPFGQRPRS